MLPETKYAKSGAHHIAYQVVGDGPIDLVLVHGFISNVEGAWSNPLQAQLFTRLASFARLIRFDKRGTGLSDPVSVKDLVAGSEIRFKDHGRHVLKGVPGKLALYAALAD